MDARKYYKTIIRFEVLSEGAPFEGSLERLAAETTDGEMSGRFLESEVVELSPDAARAALVEQGSDPGFLYGLDGEEGEEADATADEVAAA